MFRMKLWTYEGTRKLPLNIEQFELSLRLEMQGDRELVEWLLELGVRPPKQRKDLPRLLAAVLIAIN